MIADQKGAGDRQEGMDGADLEAVLDIDRPSSALCERRLKG